MSKQVLEKFRLDGRVALVTGATRNIGLALAHGLAEVGADILAVGRDAAALAATANAIHAASGRRVVTVSADMGRAEDVQRVIDTGLAAFDRLDVLVLNAASLGRWAGEAPPAITDMSDAQWDDAYRVNVLANYQLIRGFTPRLLAGGKGSVITLLSGAAFIPVEHMICYGATKAALWQMTKYLAQQEPRIRFNALTPGRVSDSSDPPSPAEQNALALAPMQRRGHPDELIGACVYLASDASSYTTGEVIFCNGGRAWG
jgi:NAD(P)-dependent dehydrogenase (short-subunit alcohol dehydrogenase family)